MLKFQPATFRQFVAFLSVFFLACGLTAGRAAAADADAPLEQIRLALQAKDYDAAVVAADAYAKTDGKSADEAAYLKGVALFHAGKFQPAVEAADVVLTRHANSSWRHKALHLKGNALTRLRQFDKAQAIFDAEAHRLLASGRKKEIAGIIVRFADTLAAEPDPKDVGATPPNFAKAYGLYGKALTLEIDLDLRDDVMFKRAATIQKANNHAQAITDFESYLREFDPLWYAPGEARPAGAKKIALTGKHRFAARYHLSVARIAAGQQAIARQQLEDLLTLLDKAGVNGAPGNAAEAALKQLRADATWAIVESWQMPGVGEAELDQAVKAAGDFLKKYADHPNAIVAAWLIPTSYTHHGRNDQAIAAYEAFIKGDIYKLPPGDAASAKLKTHGKSPLELKDEWGKAAVYQIGQILYAQRKHKEAIAQWQRYVNQFPNGAQWADSQRMMITAEYDIALEAVTQKKYDDARKLFDEFLKAHPLDERAPQALFTLGQMHVAEAQALEENKAKQEDINAAYQKAIDEWLRLVSKYPGHEASSLALYRVAVLREEKLADLDKALEDYRRLNWGTYAAHAQGRVAIMTQKHLAVETQRTFRSNEPAKIKLNARNVEKLTIKQYYLDLEAYFRKTHVVGGVDQLDIALIAPDKQWDIKLDQYAKYKPLEQQIEIPFDKAKTSVCIINVSEEDLESTTLVVRSDLDLVMKTSRREALVYVQDMLAGKPAGGVDVLLSDGAKIIATGKTGDDGVFRQKIDSLKDCGTVRVFARKAGSVASNIVNLHGLEVSTGLSRKGYIFSDRPAYEPGQAVSFRAILREVKDGQYVIPDAGPYLVSVSDPAGRLLREEELKLNEFGSLSSQLPLDATAPLGSYSILVRLKEKPEIAYTGAFQVQRYQLQKMRLALDFDRRVYFRGEPVKATITAEYYWGEPVAGRQVRYTLPDGRSFIGTTSNKGKLEVTFDTTPMPIGSALHFNAAIEGENIAIADSVFLARLGYMATVKPSADLVLGGEPFDVNVKTTTPDGKPTGSEMTLIVLRREVSKPDLVLSVLPWSEAFVQEFDLNAALSNTNSGGQQARQVMERRVRRMPYGEVTVSEHKVTTDAKTGEGKVRLTLDKGGYFLLRVTGKDRFDQPIVSHGRVFVSDDDDATKLRILADADKLKVGEKSTVQLLSRLDNALALVTFEGEEIIAHRIVTLKKGKNAVDFAVDHEHYPNFTLAAAAMDGRDLRLAAKPFTVERQLIVKVEPEKKTVQPGDNAKVGLIVTDQLGRPVKAELSLALVDEALHALYGDSVPPILDFFQGEAYRHAEFRAASTCGFRYSGVTRSVIKEYLEEGERLARQAQEVQQLGRVQDQLKQLSEQRRNVQPQLQRAQRGQTQTLSLELAESEEELELLANDMDGEGQADDLLLLNDESNAALGGRRMDRAQRFGVTVFSGRAHRAGQTFAAYDGAPNANAPQPQGGQGGGAPAGGPIVRRQELPDAGFWAPAIVTDDSGKATVTIPMPANTTKWRLTARGCTVKTLVGEATSDITTRKDFFVELKLPPALREGDKPRVLARIHNLSDFAGPVKLTLTVVGPGGRKFNSFTQQINIDKQATVEAIFDAFETPAIAGLEFEVLAEAGDQRDLVVRSVPVQPWGLEFADHGGGTATGDANVGLALPKNQKYTSTWMTLAIGPSLKQAIIDLAMSDAPRGSPMLRSSVTPAFGSFPGTELLAVLGGLEYAKQTNAAPKAYETLAAKARALTATLVVTQHSGGGWAWQGFGDGRVGADWHVSAISYWALIRATQLGIKVDANALKKAESYLQNVMTQLPSTDLEARAVVTHGLSVSKAVDFTHVNALHRERQRLSPLALAYTALAFANLERNELAEEVLAVLEARVKKQQRDGRKLASWGGDAAGAPAGAHAWLTEEVETTAIALLAMTRAKPTSALAPQAAQWLLAAKGCAGFTPAKSRGPAVAALAAWFGRGQFAGDDYKLTILVNGNEVKTIERKGDMPLQFIEVPAAAIKEGDNMVTFRMQGQGQYAFAATLRGFSPDMTDPRSFDYPHVIARHYRHAPLEYQGKPINAGSTSPVKNLEVGQRAQVYVDLWPADYQGYLVIEEHLPSGTRLVEGSLRGGFSHYEVHDNRVVLYYPQPLSTTDLHYEIVGFASGDFRVLPTVIRDAMRPDRMRLGKPDAITVLPPGVKSPDPYQMNDSERFALGTAYFNDGLYKQALEFLPALFDRENKAYEREVARMLLWIHTSDSFYDARRIVETFEILRRKFPDLTIPFDKILVVGKAYKDIGEHERSMLVYRATIDNSFINDSNVSAMLQDEGQLLGSIDYQENLWREYPDTAEVVGAYFALTQVLYEKAAVAHTLGKQNRGLIALAVATPQAAENKGPTKVEMLKQTIEMLRLFLTLYPENPLADDAAFTTSNVLLDLKAYDTVVKLSETFGKRYGKSDFASSFQYMIALGHFWRRDYEPALKAARVVADGASKDRDFARYILGQIYHAEGKPAEAIPWYKLVEQKYSDAKQAIGYFEEKRIGIEEVTVIRPGKPVELALKYRNIKEAHLQVYKVDLMKLYLREKNLSRITAVNLAGIEPQLVRAEPLGDGKDYVEKEKTAKLDLKDEGAYLVICRGDDLFASGLVLITPLEIEVQEDPAAGQVRANVIDKVTAVRPAEVHVKAIGSADTKFKAGETDLRGLFVADGLRGTATVIARSGDARYAFYRGKSWLGAAMNQPPAAAPSAKPPAGELDYQGNLKLEQKRIQLDNSIKFDQFRRQQNKGVEVQKAY